MPTSNRTTKIIAFAVAIALLGVARVVLGPVYRMYDGCACGRQRAWLNFDEFARLRYTKLFIKVADEGDREHLH